jgi:hypothetical protein
VFHGNLMESRRSLLKGGVASLAGASLGVPSLALANQRGLGRALFSGRAKHVIHLYLHGGAPTQDMFDLKPAAPVEIRGEFRPIATNVAGIEICEHLPQTARWMHRAAIVRSVHHKSGCHNCLPSFSGSEQPVDINELVPRDTFPPGMGAVCEYVKPPEIELPHYVALPTWLGWGFALKRPGPWGGFLGPRYDPLVSDYQPAQDKPDRSDRQPVWMGAPTLAAAELPADVTPRRLSERRELLAEVNRLAAEGTGRPSHPIYGRRSVPATASPAANSAARTWQRAFGLLTASKLRRAFDLSKEDPRLRDRYGRHLVGSSALIARRLIEAEVRFVDVYFDGYSSRLSTGFDTYWDTHANNFVQLRRANLPLLDQTLPALLGDLETRGLLDETLVVVNTDFGRTPRVNASAGRDHWTDCYSVVFAGAGIRGGTVVGASDAHAAYVKDRPVRPAEICATVLHCLGIDPDTPVYDRVGRPTPAANGGEPIREVLA